MPTPSTSPLHRRLFLVAFGLFVGSVVFSLAGAFLLNYAPGQAGVALAAIARSTGLTLEHLIKLPTWINMGMLLVLSLTLYFGEMGTRPDGTFERETAWARSLAFLVIGCVVGATAELVGTQTGFPFGAYSYGDFLGAKIAGHVPWLIPASWYALSIVSLDLARRLGLGRWGRIAAVPLFMVLWDVALDPAMSHAFPFWKYAAADGVFFGMPLVNWAGWALTSAAIAAGYEVLLGGLRPAPDAFVARWAPVFYAVNTLFSVGICVAYKVPLAGLPGLVGLAVVFGLLYARRHAAPPLADDASRDARPEGAVALAR